VEALALGALGLALLAVGLLLRSSGLLAWGLVALGGEYSVWFAAQGLALDEYAPLYAATFLLVAELAYWSIELRGRAHEAERLTERRAALIAILALLAISAGGVVLAATAVDLGSGVAIDLLGIAAAVAALAVVATLARPRV